MGALTSNRKRADECFSLCSPSPSFNHWDNFYRNYQTDTHISKEPRISYIFQRPGRVNVSSQSTISRLQSYPEPTVKLRREVHAPCRVNTFGFLSHSSRGLKRRDSGIGEKTLLMGNKLRRQYEKTKHKAIGALRHVKIDKEVIDVKTEPKKEGAISKDSSEVEIIEDGHEVSSVVSDDNNKVLETQKLVDIQAASSGKMLDSSLLDRDTYKKLLIDVDRSYSDKLTTLKYEIDSTEAKWQSLRSLQSLKKSKEEKPVKDLLHEIYVPLTEEEEREVARAFSNSNRRKILVTHEYSNIQITGEILQCLRPGAWLNDEVINVYLELLKEREKREPEKFLNCHFFNTFFYKKLVGGRNGYDYRAVRRWTTQKKLGYGLIDCDKIFVPIHKEVHWCLAVINKKHKSFQYLDSLGGRDFQVLRVLARYFVDEVRDKSGQDIDVTSWEHEFVEDLPEQQNGFDCGVFMIKYADFYSRGMGLHFAQENMPYFRHRTAKEILRLRAD